MAFTTLETETILQPLDTPLIPLQSLPQPAHSSLRPIKGFTGRKLSNSEYRTAIILQEITQDKSDTSLTTFSQLPIADRYHSIYAFEYEYETNLWTLSRGRFRKAGSRTKLSEALVLASRDGRYSHILRQTRGVTLFGTPHYLAGLGEWAILFARENNIDAAPTPQKQDWEECSKELVEIADMQREFQVLVEGDLASSAVICCFSTPSVQPSSRSRKAFDGLSPEWAILPGAKVAEIPRRHYDMMRFSDITDEDESLMDLLQQALHDYSNQGKGRCRLSPSQSGVVNPSMPKSKPPECDLQYWLLRPSRPANPKVGDIVNLVAEPRTGPEHSDVELGQILVAREIQSITSTPVEPNATTEISNDGTVRFAKRAAQKRRFTGSFQVLRLWRRFAKRKFPRLDLRFNTIKGEMWEATNDVLDRARQHRSASIRTSTGSTPSRHKDTYVVIETFSYTKKGGWKCGKDRGGVEGTDDAKNESSEVTFAVRTAKPRQILTSESQLPAPKAVPDD
ncbi:hypothetical protein F5Y10DRAFT_292131 [Nemania abortiva]|nr:hypothetical protein F5Y10DRAFT_292131 [Nemania abortiva]